MTITTTLGAALLATLASLQTAQPQTTQEPPTITVTGDPQRKEDLEKLTRSISQQDAGQLARFEDKVCVSVGGLAAPYNRIVATRMEQDAAEAGIAVGKPGCHPNVIVIITDHVQKEIQSLSHNSGLIAGTGLKIKDLQQLAQGSGPAYILTFTQLRTGDGMPPQPGFLLQKDAPQLAIHDSSIIHPLTRQDIAAVLMVLDSKATLGKNLSQIADYAALRTLAHLKDMPPETKEPTILTLFRDASAPDGLTIYDRAYLKGLYSGPSAMSAEMRMHEIVNVAVHPDKR